MYRRVINTVRINNLKKEVNLDKVGMRSGVVKDQKCHYSIQMNEDAKLFNASNKITRRDAAMYLKQYADKFKWNGENLRILDVGCADGSVTQLLKQYIPNNYETLLGCDLSEKMVKFANEHYSNNRNKFIQLDIADDLPRELSGSFDYVFSFYVLNWIEKQEKAFTNIYKLLKNEGACFMTVLAYSPAYTLFLSLAKSNKWATYLKDVNKMVSPYYDMQYPDIKITEILKKNGFQYIDVRCKQTIYIYKSSKELRSHTMAINPFKFPEDSMYEGFANDFVQLARKMRLYDDTNDTYKFIYNLIVVHCTK